jgi:cytidylate kinase
MKKDIIIAIDGYSSCGKSTLAKALAEKLGYIYIDSGAMYRAVTLYFIDNEIDINNQQQIKESLKNINIKFQNNLELKRNETLLNGKVVEDEIRSMKVSQLVSPVSAIPVVRDFLVAQQSRMGINRGIVMDGRDIGTIVFPDAELKLFMKASKEIRAERRWNELKDKGVELGLDTILDNLEKRDYTDTHRDYNPLRKAFDAIELDNSSLTESEQLDWVFNEVKKIIQ